MAKNNSQEEAISDINIVPLVDIILVVLIIFMVTAPTMTASQLALKLPESSQNDTSEISTFNISVNDQGQIYYQNEQLDEASLKRKASDELSKNNELTAVVAADATLPYGQIIQVLDWIKSTGVKNLSVSTQDSK